jgi:TonB-linked SusC/RagA family outer membrane protein
MSKFIHGFLLFRSGILLLTTIAIFATSTYAQSSTGESRVTLNLRNTPLKKVFFEITRQTKLYFLGNSDKLNQNERYTIKAENETVNNVLTQLLGDKGFIWTIKDNTVLIQKSGENISTNRTEFLNATTTDSLIIVTGKVVNEKGDPIIGATVLVKGTNLGTKTNQEGNFKISDVKNNITLLITSVAFLSREILVRGKPEIGLISLKEYIGQLDETVVIAYGTTTQRFSTGNVNVIKGDVIQKQNVSNPLLALAGRVPGVFITQSSGVAGSGVKILIQGQNSIAKGNEPFYVIDGVPYTSQLLSTNLGENVLGSSGVTKSVAGNPLNYINPADIESITILKDADATAIYGSRAANGAVIIITKKGEIGQVSLDINFQQGFGRVPKTLKVLDTKQYVGMRKEAIRNDGLEIQPTDYDINGFWDTTRNTNWQKELIGQSAHYTNTNVSVKGGTNLANYILSGTYRSESSVFPGDYRDDKGAIHFSLNSSSVDKKFKFQISTNYSTDNNRLPGADLTNNAIRLAPNSPEIYNSDGTLNWMQEPTGNSTFDNPYAILKNTYLNKTNNLISNVSIEYHLARGLDLKTNLGYTNLESNEIVTIPLTSYSPENQLQFQRSAAYGTNKISSWLIEPQATYRFDTNKGIVELLLGSTIQQNQLTGQRLGGEGYNSDEVLKDIKAASTVNVTSTIATVYKYTGGFGRINYNLKNKYIINLNIRRDGSSRFGPENRFHNFSSIAGAWIFSQEPMSKGFLRFLSYGKLRGSFGTTGSDQIDDYQYLNRYDVYNAGVPYQGITALKPQGLTNPYLQWEETKKLQLGLDMGVYKDKILINITYVKNTSSNQLLAYSLPITSGFSSITNNFPAKIENKSWELSISTINFSKRAFKWTSNFNLTSAKNRLLEFNNLASSSYSNLLVVGRSINITKLYNSAGVDPNTGTYLFWDSKGEKTDNPDAITDKSIIIDRLPKFYGGLQNTLRIKGFELDILFQFVKQTASGYYYGDFFPGQIYSNEPVSVLNRWQTNGDNKPIHKYGTSDNFASVLSSLKAAESNLSYGDASFIRLKNLQFSYDIPQNLTNKLRLKYSNIFIQGQNLLTFTKFDGLDPETASITSLPPLKVLMVGIKIGL